MACNGASCRQGRAPCEDGCSKPKRTCAELGVCQNRTPPCGADCLPILHQHNSDGTDPESGDHPWDWIDDLWTATKLTLIATGAGVALLAGLRMVGVI